MSARTLRGRSLFPPCLVSRVVDTSEALAWRLSRRRAMVVLNLEPADEQRRQEPKRVNVIAGILAPQ